MMKARKYKSGSPEWVMAMFFDCWKRRQWRKILNYTQGSRQTYQMKMILDGRLTDARLIQRNDTTPVVAEYLVETNTYSGRQPNKHSIVESTISKVRLIRERKGWSVIPESVM